MKILLFGGDGQLGYEINKRAFDLNFEIISPVISEVDISNFDQVKYLANEFKPDLIINCAAYTAVDKAETDADNAFLINKIGAKNVAMAADLVKGRLIHISTDYVFSGDAGNTPLKEDSPTDPKNVYGKSKLAGEDEALSATSGKCLILRTSSLFGLKGVNFPATMMKLFAQGGKVKVVSDQIMSPTWAGWLAEVILDLSRIRCEGVYNASCSGQVSWFDFAKEIYQATKLKQNYPEGLEILPVSSAEFVRPASRPKYSVMDCSKLKKTLGRELMTWQIGLKEFLKDHGL